MSLLQKPLLGRSGISNRLLRGEGLQTAHHAWAI